MKEQLINENKEIISNNGNDIVFESQLRHNYSKMKRFMNDLTHTNDIYSVVVPEDIDSFVKEGNELCHAVGTSFYISQVLTGKITVLFCRKNRNLEKPFYTIAINDKNEIVMVKGLYNKEVSSYVNHESLTSFIKQWAELNNLIYN